MIKIERTQPEPRGLAKQRAHSRTYNIKSVREQLQKDFYGNCYICGASVAHGSHIEHLRPHHGAEDEIGYQRMYDWNNLFLSCPNCNYIKNNPEFEENIIDCCKEDPELLIRHEVAGGKVRAVARKCAANQTEAETTAKLIMACFNRATDSQAAEICEQKRWELKDLSIELFQKLRQYRSLRDNPRTRAGTECAQVKNEIQDMIAVEYPYAAFLRTIVRDRLHIFPEFETVVGPDPEKGVQNR